jgi:glycosyltransferase involved in cell wall biosynthesis
MSDKVNIVTTPQEYGGVCWYRQKQFTRIASEYDLANVSEVKPKYSDRVIEKMFKKSDAFHVRFVNERMSRLIEIYKKRYPSKLVVFETDDDLHNTNPLNSAYERFGTKEVKLDDDKMLWQHGKAKLDLYENRHRMVDYEYCLEQVDAIITTTMRLKGKLEQWNDNVVVIPNALWKDYWPEIDIKRRDKDEIRVGYTCSASHFDDLRMVKPAIDTLIEKYPNLKFVNIGQVFPFITKNIPEDQLETWHWIKVDGHGYRMVCADLDIGIAPLVDNEFNRNKSCLKFYEYAALGATTVASNTPPYSDEIDDGNTGYLFDTPDQMVDQISNLIEDPLKRIEVAKNAKDWVWRNRNAVDITKDWVDFIKKAAKAKKGEYEVKDKPDLDVIK